MNLNLKTSHMVSNDWKLPLNLAIGLHVLVVLSSIYLPGFFKAKPKFADIYTVSIINVAEPVVTPPPAAPEPKVDQPKAAVKKITTPAKLKKAVSIAEPVTSTESASEEAISLKPLKKKIVKKKIEPKIEKKPRTVSSTKEKKEKDYQAQKRRQDLADAIREEELLAQRADLAREAVEMEKNLFKQRENVSTAVTSLPNSNSTSINSTKVINSGSSQAGNLYNAAIINRLHQFWALPETMRKHSGLVATAVITINKNGQIIDIFFENRSGDRVFDQFVLRSINAANPMPPIPAALRKQRMEVGLVFKPGGIQ